MDTALAPMTDQPAPLALATGGMPLIAPAVLSRTGSAPSVPLSRRDESPHATGVSSDAGSARGYFIWLMPFLSTRYLFEAAKVTLNELKPDWLQTKSARRASIIERFVTAEESEITPALRQDAIRENVRVEPGHNAERSEAALLEAQARHREYLSERASLKDASPQDPLTRARSELNEIKGREVRKFIRTASKEIREMQLGHIYDTPLGLGSVAVTSYYASHVWKNIHNLFAETVAYEQGKQPGEIGFGDLWKSDNKVVQDALTNYCNKNMERFGGDLIFFGRHLGRVPGLAKAEALPFGTLGIGIKALSLFAENKRHRTTTMFEDLVQLVDEKINPEHGIGHPITGADIASLYQKYALIHTPRKSAGADGGGINWGQSEPIFAKAAELMNETYRQRYYPTSEAAGHVPPDFPLPKMLYLLGNGLIDPYRPERTMEYIDVASSQGIEALKALVASPDQPVAARIAVAPHAALPTPAAANANLPSSRIIEPAEPQRLGQASHAIAAG